MNEADVDDAGSVGAAEEPAPGVGPTAWPTAAPGAEAGAEAGGGAVAQLASAPRIAAGANWRSDEPERENHAMWLIVLEALAALGVLVFLVWWTMFSGRRRGERTPDDDPQ